MRWPWPLFGTRRAPALNAEQGAALAAWQQLPAADLKLAHERSRYVVVDVETSGLDMRKDRLIAIGAVAVVGGRVDVDDSFAAVLRQDEVSSAENILIHGIGASAQSAGMEPAAALLSFLAYLGKSPLVAYHAFFDQAMIDKALRRYLGSELRQTWIDLAWILPALFAGRDGPGRGDFHAPVALDDWLRVFAIDVSMRHNALADAYATAQLLLMAIFAGQRSGAGSPAALVRMEKARRWMLQSR